MSIEVVRRALERHLAAMTPLLSTAYEGVTFAPVNGTPYQRVNLLPATPDNSTQGQRTYFEQGIFQITLLYPTGVGPSAIEARAKAILSQFRRGTTLVDSGISVHLPRTPARAGLQQDGDRQSLAISVRYSALIVT